MSYMKDYVRYYNVTNLVSCLNITHLDACTNNYVVMASFLSRCTVFDPRLHSNCLWLPFVFTATHPLASAKLSLFFVVHSLKTRLPD